ncbi:MAG: hypothetical protein GEU96_16680 [Propionibacteriales bacterium]|nr:hypothetical protein [Propionibacteriales bacterium]
MSIYHPALVEEIARERQAELLRIVDQRDRTATATIGSSVLRAGRSPLAALKLLAAHVAAPVRRATSPSSPAGVCCD